MSTSANDWDNDDFFKGGWSEPTPILKSKKRKEPKVDETGSKKFIESSPKTSTIVDSPKVKDVILVNWLLDELCKQMNSDRIHLKIEDHPKFDPMTKTSTEEFTMKAHPIAKNKFSEKIEGVACAQGHITCVVNPKLFETFAFIVLKCSTKVNPYMPYIITIQGEIATYDISLCIKYQDLLNVGGFGGKSSTIGFYPLDDKHLSNKNSLVATFFKAMKEVSSTCEPVSGISQRFYAFYHAESKIFVLIKIPI